MAFDIRKYRIGAHRLELAYKEGLILSEEGVLRADGFGSVSTVFFPYLDGVSDGCPWARLVFDAEVSEDTVFTVKTFASDENETLFHGEKRKINDILLDPAVPIEEKNMIFGATGEQRTSIYRDSLLDGQNGRYLWISLTVQGGRASFANFRAFTPGDLILRTFPEIYREQGSFFNRYLSIFSSLYTDLQERIDKADELLNIETAPAELLPIIADWFGITLDGDFIDEDLLRRFLSKAYGLIRRKGTRDAIEELVSIFVDEPFYIVEHADVYGKMAGTDKKALTKIYGDDPFSFTLLLQRKPDEKLQLRLDRLIGQFKPLRMKVRIQFIEDRATLDGGANLDVNAKIAKPSEGLLDETAVLNTTDFLA
ncbi:MAG: hypothetical protein LBN34_02845 [Clostridiales Family XIII bacterium]|nr:hypothetical protein [Clostridiales Family XIII bacterium]